MPPSSSTSMALSDSHDLPPFYQVIEDYFAAQAHQPTQLGSKRKATDLPLLEPPPSKLRILSTEQGEHDRKWHKPSLHAEKPAKTHKPSTAIVASLRFPRDEMMQILCRKQPPTVNNLFMESSWSYVRDHVNMYPLAIYYMTRFFIGLYEAYRRNPSSIHYSTIGSLVIFQNQWSEKVQEWNKLDIVNMLVIHSEIRGVIDENIDFARRATEGDLVMDPAWPDFLKATYRHDRNDMSQLFSRVLASPKKQHIKTLPVDELNAIMSLLQALIDEECLGHRVLERFLEKLVSERGLLPRYLFVANARRTGQYPAGGGGFADVWRGEVGLTPVALKVLRVFGPNKERNKIHQEFCREAMIWRQLKHPNLIPFYGVCTDLFAPQLAMVSPWMEHGNLSTYLKETTSVSRVSVIRGIARGLRYLHTMTPQVIHGDLRAANVLIDADGTPRITDFGLAKIIDSQASTVAASSFNGKGTMRWQAPELLIASRFEAGTGDVAGPTSRSDMYAFACLCLEVFTGEVPFANLRDGNVIVEVAVNNKRPPRPAEPAARKGLNDRMWDIIQDCWRTQPTERPDIAIVVDRLSHESFDTFQNKYDAEDSKTEAVAAHIEFQAS